MKNRELIEYSQNIKLQAQEILQENNVIQTLNQYGEVIITGSYKFDLMYGPDIDLEVITDNPRKASLNALQDFLADRKFQKYEYGDFEKHSRKNRPESFIIVLIQEVNGVKWEIEIWFFKERDEEKEKFEKKLMNLSQEQKTKILELKHQRNQSDLSKHNISSYEIYKAVLNKGVKSLKKV